MNRGGVETWLMHVLRHIDRERFHMDFLVHTEKPGAYDEEIRSLGAEIIPCPNPSSRPWTYARNFKRILREQGPYNVVHSHVHNFSGYVLRLARQEGIPIRISHSHTVTSRSDEKAGAARRIYLSAMKRWIDKHSTLGLAASRKAASALFGPGWQTDPRWRVLYYGVDPEPFQATVDPVAVRAELGIPKDAFVVGHVGSFREPKNHTFLVRVAAEVAKREPNMRLLLIGDGPLYPTIEQQVTDLGIADKVVFAGLRADIPRLMLGAMDVFVFPSVYEGLGLVGVEAQVAGLPVILSDTIPEDIEVIHSLIRRLSLSQPVSRWAEAIMEAHGATNKANRPDTLGLLEQSRFNIWRTVKELEGCYAHTQPR